MQFLIASETLLKCGLTWLSVPTFSRSNMSAKICSLTILLPAFILRFTNRSLSTMLWFVVKIKNWNCHYITTNDSFATDSKDELESNDLMVDCIATTLYYELSWFGSINLSETLLLLFIPQRWCIICYSLLILSLLLLTFFFLFSLFHVNFSVRIMMLWTFWSSAEAELNVKLSTIIYICW